MKLKQKLAIDSLRARINILALVSVKSAAASAFDLFCTPLKKPARKEAPLFDKGEKLSFKLEGHTMRGHRWLPHQPSAGLLKKALIAHGFESYSRNFEHYVDRLLKKGYEVLAFDAPAHGRSGGRRILLPDYVRMLQHVVEEYGPVQSFLGHSLGGLAMTLLLESPAFGEEDRLVLIAPVCEMTEAADTFFQYLKLNKEIRTAFDERVVELNGHPLSYYSISRALQQVQAGVLWIQDEDDEITPLQGALAVQKEGHPNITFHFTKGLGHRKIYRDPEVIQQVVEFL